MKVHDRFERKQTLCGGNTDENCSFHEYFEIEDQKILITVSFAVVGRKDLSEDANKRKKWLLSDEQKERKVSETLALEACFNLHHFVLIT